MAGKHEEWSCLRRNSRKPLAKSTWKKAEYIRCCRPIPGERIRVYTALTVEGLKVSPAFSLDSTAVKAHPDVLHKFACGRSKLGRAALAPWVILQIFGEKVKGLFSRAIVV